MWCHITRTYTGKILQCQHVAHRCFLSISCTQSHRDGQETTRNAIVCSKRRIIIIFLTARRTKAATGSLQKRWRLIVSAYNTPTVLITYVQRGCAGSDKNSQSNVGGWSTRSAGELARLRDNRSWTRTVYRVFVFHANVCCVMVSVCCLGASNKTLGAGKHWRNQESIQTIFNWWRRIDDDYWLLPDRYPWTFCILLFYQSTVLSTRVGDRHQMHFVGSVVGKALTVDIEISPTPPLILIAGQKLQKIGVV